MEYIRISGCDSPCNGKLLANQRPGWTHVSQWSRTPIFSGTQCNTGQLLCCGDRMDSTPKLRHSGIVSFYACVFLQKEWTEAEPQLPLERPTMGEAQVAHDGSFFLWGQWEAGEGAACRAHGSSDDPHVTSSHGPFSSFSVDEPRT